MPRRAWKFSLNHTVNMARRNNNNNPTSSDNEADMEAAAIVTQPFALGDWVRDEQQEQIATPSAGQRECTNEVIQQHNDGGAPRCEFAMDIEAESISIPAPAAAAVPDTTAPKAKRKNVTRAGQRNVHWSTRTCF